VFAQNLVDDVPAPDEQEQRVVFHENLHEKRRLMNIAPEGLYHMPRIQLDIQQRQLGIGKFSQMSQILERNLLRLGFRRHVGDTNIAALAKLEKRPPHIRRLGVEYFAEIVKLSGGAEGALQRRGAGSLAGYDAQILAHFRIRRAFVHAQYYRDWVQCVRQRSHRSLSCQRMASIRAARPPWGGL
jgi:hypothetical protein